ncbi:HGGxSTG domain-containing protein [Streptomyces sp. AcH 505]|uniref:HGGxSTG domain-containing protein n=1 Tax=Streptomyces sp. AcH 505 TaxID=352211 RepID=UPI00069434D8
MPPTNLTTPTPERKCTATAKRSGKPCLRWALKGQKVCRVHGGRAPQALAAAERRITETKLMEDTERALARLNVAPVDNPLTALSQLAGQVLAWKDALADRVNDLNAVRFTDEKGAEQLRSEVALYERAMDRSVNVLGVIGRLKIDERLAAISEAQAKAVIAAIEAALAHAGVTGRAAVEAKQIAARHLRAV